MKSIVRKRLVALLSLAGFAGSAASATAQVLKGSEPAKTSTSKIKVSKTKQENKAVNGQSNIKFKKNGSAQYPIEHGREASTTNTKSDATIKLSKNKGESNAAQKAAWVKGGKTAAGASAAQIEGGKKASQTAPK